MSNSDCKNRLSNQECIKPAKPFRCAPVLFKSLQGVLWTVTCTWQHLVTLHHTHMLSTVVITLQCMQEKQQVLIYLTLLIHTWQPQLAAHDSCIHDTPVRVTHCTPLPIMKDLNTAIRLPITTNQSDCCFLSGMVGICDNTSKHSVHHRLK